ncbi:hypothetical protein GOP47_0018887 [Adiantum capillus-veneris]|uniref:Ketose-bisphosphate aldolase class-II family protein n=1 Tax=Adiantum capillus-veneris TaxID=13818 RepID=A0A9D4Z8K4_ADICA|nr:hypothetical protein GOP47_0018887 [Adiantum capillus-veneris]
MAPSETVGFISDGSLGCLLANKLSQCGFHVRLCSTTAVPEADHKDSNLSLCNSPKEATQGASVICLAVRDLQQFEAALVGALSVIVEGTIIVLSGAVLPSYLVKLDKRLTEEKRGLLLVDFYASVGSDSKLKILASGNEKALEKTQPVLSAMCDDLVLVKGDLGGASKVQMVDKLLMGVHIAAAAEAMALGASAGLNTWDLYEIIINAAGSSRAFETRVPQMLSNGDSLGLEMTTIDHVTNDMNSILEEARMLLFPLPLAAIAHQYFHMGSSCGYGTLADATVVKVWERVAGRKITECLKNKQGSFSRKAEEIFEGAKKVESVGFIGLGAMGFGMASTLVQKKFTVCGFDVYEPTLSRFRKAGGLTRNSVEEASKGAQVVIVMVATEAQAEAVLFGDRGAVAAVPSGCTFLLCSTVSPLYVEGLQKRLEAEGRDIQLVDAPVSGGVKRAADGTLTIMAAGSTEAFRRAGQVLQALSETLYVIDGGAGKGSAVKVVNQLLAGVHIAAACEAMALGSRLGLNPRDLYQTIAHSNGSSWMFVNRVPHMLDADYTPYSAVNIFVKDLGIVLSQGKSCGVHLHLAATAHQQFLLAAAGGFAFQDDSAVVKIYEKLAGISVACKEEPVSGDLETPQGPSIPQESSKVQVVSKSQVLESLCAEWPKDPVNEISRLEESKQAKVLVVLDDDPTGTQTVHGITVLTEWSVDSIKEEFLKQSSCFFILTNSRALSSEKASILVQNIATNVKAAATLTDRPFTIVLRGDSTLRGHFPEELDAVASIIGETDAWIICPFFPQGGRYTIHDVHYVADDDKLVPAGETEFAKDAVFGYKASNMKKWVEEKTRGRIKAASVTAISIDTLRKGGPQAVFEDLCKLPKGSVCIVNAASERDISVFCAGMLQAELKGKRFLCRTAATFVSARIGIKYKAPLTPKDLGISTCKNGGLIVVGSYVPKTTKQVEELKARCAHLIHCLEVDVALIAFGSLASREAEIGHISTAADALLAAGKDTVIMTSRTLITGKDDSENLEINSKVSSALVEIVIRIQVHPRYLLAKGGITSSDLATKAMKARKAEVLGQALPGVPIWKLGVGSRHPGIPYIVFPGNVGSSTAIAGIVTSWASKPQIVKEILLEAAKEDYAVGAFNVYNLEAILAVVAAAESELSPAILQIHPSAFRHGKGALVAACISAAKTAKVPIAVHLDHGTDEQEILAAMNMGFDSIMIDCSHLPFQENLECTRRIAEAAHLKNVFVEAELGRLSGTEDGMTIEEYEEKLTDPAQADEFLRETKVDALAVCIGNVHGKYPKDGPKLKLDLLQKLGEVTSKYGTFLVLHGASGLPSHVVKECIKNGVRKFNVNTEVRSAYVTALKEPKKDLLDTLSFAEEAMKMVIAEKLKLFSSSQYSSGEGKA